jgi:hypothetical protein
MKSAAEQIGQVTTVARQENRQLFKAPGVRTLTRGFRSLAQHEAAGFSPKGTSLGLVRETSSNDITR